jgi:hypothetical protein
MRSIGKNIDLRVLSLLHALRDKEGFMQEVQKLKDAKSIDDESWDQICRMGRGLALEGRLFNPSQQARLYKFGRRQQEERRVLCRRIKAARRQHVRRESTLHWLSIERRKWERRQYLRRRTDLVSVP